MKSLLLLSIFVLIYISSIGQVKMYAPIEIRIFISLFNKPIPEIDNVLSTYTAELGDINDKQKTVMWKKGFNGDHSKNNEQIVFNYDSLQSFFYAFVMGKHWKNDRSVPDAYEGFYQLELSDPTYFSKQEDTMEKFGETTAIVKNYRYRYGGVLIKIYKIAGDDFTLIKIIQLNKN